MDIKFDIDGYRFNLRSSCIIKDKEHKKVILTYMRALNREAYILPGGRCELLESSYDNIKREIKEELGFDVEVKLISVEENFSKDTKFHMIEFVFYAEVDKFDDEQSYDDGWDKFKIVNTCDIDNYDVRPKTVKELIKQEEYNSITHNINYDWGN